MPTCHHYRAVGEVAAADWDVLAGSDPFLSHAFLTALEDTGCVGGPTGWHPRPLVAVDDSGRAVGAAPLYAKDHSFGEYVFDWGWAGAAERAGLRYYPKLVAAVPFSPVTGARLLVHPDTDDPDAVRRALLDGVREAAAALEPGAVQFLFPDNAGRAALETAGYRPRRDLQFHWHNRGDADFDAFLARLRSAKRKQIRKERRRARDTGLELRLRHGDELTAGQWRRFHAGYAAVTEMRGAPAYLSPEFFEEIAARLGDRLVLATAERGGELVASALNLRSDHVLYGRYWSALEEHDFLHFELCYYAGIDYALAEGLARFEGGAQGPHKLARGFVPTLTHSAHWLPHTGLDGAVAEFLGREGHAVLHEAEAALTELPFREEELPLGPAPDPESGPPWPGREGG
jgi:hypothetical protein